jgi:hypothetical protein
VTPRSWWINEDLEFGAVVCVRIIETTWYFVDKRLGGRRKGYSIRTFEE